MEEFSDTEQKELLIEGDDSPHTILLVEDNEELLQILNSLFSIQKTLIILVPEHSAFATQLSTKHLLALSQKKICFLCWLLLLMALISGVVSGRCLTGQLH
jgi:hypothetical protein